MLYNAQINPRVLSGRMSLQYVILTDWFVNLNVKSNSIWPV